MNKWLLIAGICFLSSCITRQNTVTGPNYAFLYNKNAAGVFPKIVPVHYTDSTEVYISFDSENLLSNDKGECSYKLVYHLLSSLDETKIIDSATFSIKTVKPHTLEKLKFKVYLPGNTAGLLIKISDEVKKITYSYISNLDKSSTALSQFFLARQDNELISNFITNDTPVTVTHVDKTTSTLTGKFYKREFPIADPPFALDKNGHFDYIADSSFSYNAGDSIKLAKEGFYLFSTDPDSKEGFSIFKFHTDFPNLTSPVKLIEPIRYLTTKREYEDIFNSQNKKFAIDQFWVELGGGPERSKELIRKFYTRVVAANKLFSSFKEGWKTDRGMIYIIFGKPSVVYKTSNSESWVYGEEGSMLSSNFTFIKVNNPFTDNDFTLLRSQIYQNLWYSAIESWRQGRPYNDF